MMLGAVVRILSHRIVHGSGLYILPPLFGLPCIVKSIELTFGFVLPLQRPGAMCVAGLFLAVDACAVRCVFGSKSTPLRLPSTPTIRWYAGALPSVDDDMVWMMISTIINHLSGLM